jgi:hypothetical protein
MTSVGHSPAADELEVRCRMGLSGLNFTQSLGRRFQLVKIRLADQYGMVLAATARNDNLSAAVGIEWVSRRGKYR